MQQRQLRLGDILDDYCPRERRLANHTIVAMVGDDIRLTRCTTCDNEHPYKGGKVPRLRKKKAEQESAPAGVLVTHTEPDEPEVPGPVSDEPVQAPVISTNNNNGDAPPAEEVRLHRPLIRAQLPRVEREPAARPVPEFTIRQTNKRPGRFQANTRGGRFAKPGGQGNSRGQGGQQGRRPHGPGSQTRPGGGRHQGQHSGPKKRSR